MDLKEVASTRRRHTGVAAPHVLVVAGVLVSLAALLLPEPGQTAGPANFEVETFATGLDTPWGMAFLPDGRMLVTERPGSLVLVGVNGKVSAPIAGVPEVCACGQGGMLDVQLHPDYEENGWLYLAYADLRDGSAKEGFTAVMRARLEGTRLVDRQDIFKAPRKLYSRRGQHYGSRIVFDDAGYLYFSIGDRGLRDQAQRLNVPNGKVHRLHDDGRIPKDNPFTGTPGAVASIWSYGHRNPQGMDLHPETRALWAAEHGPRGGDELNLVRRGLNYGWPVITFGINYDGTKITDVTEKAGMEQPALHWTPSIAVCGVAFYDGDVFPDWRNDLFVTSLKFEEVRRVVLDGATAVDQGVLFKPDGRPRDIVIGPDGYLYIAIEASPGRIVRLIPRKS